MLNKFKLSTRINILGIMIIICFTGILIWLYPQFKKKMYDAKYLKTKSVVETAYGVLVYYHRLSKAEIMTSDQAKTMAIEVVRSLRYEEHEYFWMADLNYRMLMHPFNPELEGRILSDLKDTNGKRIIFESVEIAKKKGDGFVDYYWNKPGEKKPMPKISYVKFFSEWSWLISSGIYVDDVEKEIAKVTGIISLVVIFITIFAFFIVNAYLFLFFFSYFLFYNHFFVFKISCFFN